MQVYSQDTIPVILVSSVNKKIVGLAPLLLRKHLVSRSANFLLPYYVSPDFVVADEYREEVLRIFLNIIVKKMQCKLIDLDFPIESQNLPILENVYTDYKLIFTKQIIDTISHCVILVQNSSAEYEEAQRAQFKKKFRRISRNLDEAGDWKTITIDNLQNAQMAYDKMMIIEKKSWKENWRLNTGSTIDKDLQWIWDASLSAANTNPDFKCKVWFLELDDQAIAYQLVIEYRGTVFFAKTSFVEKYRHLSPGLFVQREIIAEQFKRKEIETIDFLTNLPYMKTWNVTRFSRVKFTFNQSSISNLFVKEVMALLYRFRQIIETHEI